MLLVILAWSSHGLVAGFSSWLGNVQLLALQGGEGTKQVGSPVN